MKDTEYDINDIIEKLKTKKLSETTFNEAIHLKINSDIIIVCKKIQKINNDLYCVYTGERDGISDILLQYDTVTKKCEIVKSL